MTPDERDNGDAARADERATFRATLIRVLAVQAATLLLLWLLHARYTVS